MSLPLTTEMLARAYHYLEATPPFRRWNLPDAEDVVFKVVKDPAVWGWYVRDHKGRHVIACSRGRIGTSESLIKTMGHEMVHCHQGHTNMETGAEHNKAFWRLAASVCRAHGWDLKEF